MFHADAGWSYAGTFIRELFGGLGRETFVDGAVYEGEFDMGKRSGVGVKTTASHDTMGMALLEVNEHTCKIRERERPFRPAPRQAPHRRVRAPYTFAFAQLGGVPMMQVGSQGLAHGPLKATAFVLTAPPLPHFVSLLLHHRSAPRSPLPPPPPPPSTRLQRVADSGEWVADKREGYGVEVLHNGTTYVGQFKNNRRHGLGTLDQPMYDPPRKTIGRLTWLFETDAQYQDLVDLVPPGLSPSLSLSCCRLGVPGGRCLDAYGDMTAKPTNRPTGSRQG